jgi:formiminoglutamase
MALPQEWMSVLIGCFRRAFGADIAVNKPFSGGYITRRHGQHRSWVQIELSRSPWLPNQEKRARLLRALTDFCRTTL